MKALRGRGAATHMPRRARMAMKPVSTASSWPLAKEQARQRWAVDPSWCRNWWSDELAEIVTAERSSTANNPVRACLVRLSELPSVRGFRTCSSQSNTTAQPMQGRTECRTRTGPILTLPWQPATGHEAERGPSQPAARATAEGGWNLPKPLSLPGRCGPRTARARARLAEQGPPRPALPNGRIGFVHFLPGHTCCGAGTTCANPKS
jgi:hypothetical protein